MIIDSNDANNKNNNNKNLKKSTGLNIFNEIKLI